VVLGAAIRIRARDVATGDWIGGGERDGERAANEVAAAVADVRQWMATVEVLTQTYFRAQCPLLDEEKDELLAMG